MTRGGGRLPQHSKRHWGHVSTYDNAVTILADEVTGWPRCAPPLLCQWQADGLDVPGATNRWQRVDKLEELHTTRYQVVVRNAWGTATNLIATLTRQKSPPLLSEIVLEGGRFRCTVSRTSAKRP